AGVAVGAARVFLKWDSPSDGQGTTREPGLESVPFPDPVAYQRSWAESRRLPVFTRDETGLDLVIVPPGRFTMGSSMALIEELLAQEANDRRRGWLRGEAQHEIVIEHPFYLGVVEVTVGQFRRFVATTGYKTMVERSDGGYGMKAGRW